MTNESEIRQMIEKWALAVRNRDLPGILAHHSADITMFDVPPPFVSLGLDAYRKTWDTFFTGTQQGIFDIIDLKIKAGEDVAFCYATMKCSTSSGGSGFAELPFRLTIGLERQEGQWTIVHEHHSIPARQRWNNPVKAQRDYSRFVRK